MKYSLTLLFLALSLVTLNAQEPKPFGALPSPQQLAWHRMERYAFIHFSMNTFTGKEWGDGSEDPRLFKPDSLDCRQWARILKEAGFKAIILTAKHHDGFCLWPSGYTEHSVKSSKWRDGKGDVVQELSEACREYGLKMGLYYSPWDRNHPAYGRPEYRDYMKNQLSELLSLYGDVFEVWFDGANGGDGWYGGAKEKREVDRQAYYQWESLYEWVKHYQPDALIFSDGGPDIRWVGNEDGMASETNWCTLNRHLFYPGSPLYPQLGEGHKGGTHWVPAEADVSIRPGWYYHPEQDTQVKSVTDLMHIYHKSVGRNANLLLNIPVNPKGRISPQDSARLMEFHAALQKAFSRPLATRAEISASCTATGGKAYSLEQLTDGNPDTWWVSGNDCPVPVLELSFPEKTEVAAILLQEGIRLGQRVERFTVEAFVQNTWKEIAAGTTIGYKRILRFNPVKTTRIRISFHSAAQPVVISEINLY